MRRPPTTGRDPDRQRDTAEEIAKLKAVPGKDLVAAGGTEFLQSLINLGVVDEYRRWVLPATTGNLDAVGHLMFSRDGTLLASAGSEGDVVLWDMTPVYTLRRDPTRVACQIIGHGLTRDEWTRNVPSLPYQNTCS
jgi:RibD domain-containing protein